MTEKKKPRHLLKGEMKHMRAVVSRIPEELREGCLIMLEGIATGKPFGLPPEYLSMPLVAELHKAGVIIREGESEEFELTHFGKEMLEQGFLDDC